MSSYFASSPCLSIRPVAKRLCRVVVAVALLAWPSFLNAQGLLYTVNTTSDAVVVGACENGDPGCSLRGAIGTANAHPGVDGIRFNIPGLIIQLQSALPSISEGVSIIGPGANLLTVRRNTGGDYRIFNVATTGTVTLGAMTISNGNVGGGAGGGAIANSSTGIVNVSNCVLTGNHANTGAGGGILNGNAPATLNVTNCTIKENSAFAGGGIASGSGTVNVTNSTLSANSSHGNASGGGGIHNTGGTVNLSNSTLSGNSAVNGGGVYNSAAMSIKSSILALNTATSAGPDVLHAGFDSIASAGFNLIGKNDGAAASFPAGTPNANNDLTGTSSSPVDPKFDPAGLQNNGGRVQTIALLPDSPALDHGTSHGLTSTPTTDQRGTDYPRTFDYPTTSNAAGGNGTDIGAFELLTPYAVSRRMHGSMPFVIDLPLTGTLGVECRAPTGLDLHHEVITTFAADVTSVTSTSVTGGTGMVSAVNVEGPRVFVYLTGVSDAQEIVFTIFGVGYGTTFSDVSIPMGVLLGDTNGSASVNSGDALQTRNRSGETSAPTNFRSDFNVDGIINSGDAFIVRARSGQAIP